MHSNKKAAPDISCNVLEQVDMAISGNKFFHDHKSSYKSQISAKSTFKDCLPPSAAFWFFPCFYSITFHL